MPHRTLAGGIEDAHLVDGISEKFQAQRLVVPRRQHVENIAASGHVPGVSHHGYPLITPRPHVFEQQVGRHVLAPAQDKFAVAEKVGGRQTGNEVVGRKHQSPRHAPAQAVQHGQASGPSLQRQGPVIERRQIGPGTVPDGTGQGFGSGAFIGPPHRKIGGEQSGQPAHEGQFVAGPDHHHRAAPGGHGLRGQTGHGGRAAPTQRQRRGRIGAGKQGRNIHRASGNGPETALSSESYLNADRPSIAGANFYF